MLRMNLLCCGINHQTAAVAVRERFTLAESTLLPALQHLQTYLNDQEAMILSTCNRLEVYTSATSTAAIQSWIAQYFEVSEAALEPLLYVHRDLDVVQHAIRVASGLDSMVLGEPQILGQMKCAYAQAGEIGSIGQQLGHLFPFVFATAKKVRTETRIGHNPTSVAYVAVNLAKQIFTEVTQAKVLLIGAGETIALAMQHLLELGVTNILVANRTLERAQTLAMQFNAQGIMIGDIPEHMAEVDIIITSTASQLPIIGKGLMERVMRQRPEKPMFIVDIAVPRDIEPEVAELSNVHLYNIDDLKNLVAENKKERDAAAVQAEQLIIDELLQFQRWQASMDSVPAICAYRQQVEQIRDDEVQKALEALQQGKAVDVVLAELARNLTNKLMHNPSVEMRKASSEGRQDFLQWSKQLLGIPLNESIH